MSSRLVLPMRLHCETVFSPSVLCRQIRDSVACVAPGVMVVRRTLPQLLGQRYTGETSTLMHASTDRTFCMCSRSYQPSAASLPHRRCTPLHCGIAAL